MNIVNMKDSSFISTCREKMKKSNAHRKRHHGATFPEDKMRECDILPLLKTTDCFRCGFAIDFDIKKGGEQFTLDRIDNTLPYQRGNVKLSHLVCNCAERHWGRRGWNQDQYKAHFLEKRNPSMTEMFDWIFGDETRHRLDSFFEFKK